MQQSERLKFYSLLDELINKDFRIELIKSVFDYIYQGYKEIDSNDIKFQRDLLCDAFDSNGNQVGRIPVYIHRGRGNLRYLAGLFDFDLLPIGDSTSLFYITARSCGDCFSEDIVSLCHSF